MDCLKRNLAELKYISQHVHNKKKKQYLISATPNLIVCMNEIIINLLFSHKNGIALSSEQKSA